MRSINKKIQILILLLAVSIILSGCGGVKQGSMEDTAKTFFQAMVNGDEETLNKINKSDPLDQPTHFLISYYAPGYADLDISDFYFEVDEEKGRVQVKRKATDKVFASYNIEKIGNKYYYMGS